MSDHEIMQNPSQKDGVPTPAAKLPAKNRGSGLQGGGGLRLQPQVKGEQGNARSSSILKPKKTPLSSSKSSNLF